MTFGFMRPCKKNWSIGRLYYCTHDCLDPRKAGAMQSQLGYQINIARVYVICWRLISTEFRKREDCTKY
jgi:hypothetical protein